jgi:hypothetical protein
VAFLILMAWGGDDKREKTITKILRLTPSENKKFKPSLMNWAE